MGRLVLFVLGLGVISFVMYKSLQGTVGQSKDPTEASAPKRQLDNVRSAAKHIEAEQQQAENRVNAGPQE